MSNQLIPINDIERMAGAIAKSGLFGVKNSDQAFALMCVAQAEGLHPAIAARDYHVISGRPTLKADAMLARFQTAGGSVKWKELTEAKATATFTHPQGGSVEITWSIEMAKRAGLLKNPTWSAYPRSMLRARCVSEGIRTVFPGVVAGYYTPEEIEDLPATQAEPKDVTPASQPAAAKKSSRLASIVDAQPEAIEGEIVTEPAPYDLSGDFIALRECDTLEALKDVFSAAWKACPEHARPTLKAEYETEKTRLTPAPQEAAPVDEEAPV
jgi:hypothetical protein